MNDNGNSERLPPGCLPRFTDARRLTNVDVSGLTARDIAILNAIADRFRQAQGTIVAVQGLAPEDVWAYVMSEEPGDDSVGPS